MISDPDSRAAFDLPESESGLNHDSDSPFYLSESETGFRIGWIILSLGPTGAFDLPESET